VFKPGPFCIPGVEHQLTPSLRMTSSRGVVAVAFFVVVLGMITSPQIIFAILGHHGPRCAASSTDWRPIAELDNNDSSSVLMMSGDFTRPLLLRNLVPIGDPIFDLNWSRAALADDAGGQTVFIDLAQRGQLCKDLVSLCDEGVFNQSSCHGATVPAQTGELLRSSAYRDSHATDVESMWKRSALSKSGLVPALHVVYKNDAGMLRGNHFDPVWTIALVLHGQRNFLLHDTNLLWNCFAPAIPGRTTSQATKHRCEYHEQLALSAYLEAGDAVFIPEWYMHAALTPERVGNEDSTLLTFRGSRFRQTFGSPSLAMAFGMQVLTKNPGDVWQMVRYFWSA